MNNRNKINHMVTSGNYISVVLMAHTGRVNGTNRGTFVVDAPQQFAVRDSK